MIVTAATTSRNGPNTVATGPSAAVILTAATSAPADAVTITPNAASIGIASEKESESSAGQSAAATAIAAASNAADFANSANRSCTRPPSKYVPTCAPA